MVADDFNKITLQCTYLGHRSRIQALCFSSRLEILLSVCRERKLNCYTTSPADENHQYSRGTYTLTTPGMSIAISEADRQCFVGDSVGNIHFLKISDDYKIQANTTCSGHTSK